MKMLPCNVQQGFRLPFLKRAMNLNNRRTDMSTTVLDALQNAKYNLENAKKGGAIGSFALAIATEQLSNAIDAMENGKLADDIIQENMMSEVNTGK